MKRPFVPFLHPCHHQGCPVYAPFGYPGNIWACRNHKPTEKR